MRNRTPLSRSGETTFVCRSSSMRSRLVGLCAVVLVGQGDVDMGLID